MKSRELFLLWIIIPLLTSCITTDNFRTIRPEVFGPGLLDIDSIETIAIFNRDQSYIGLDTFYYYDAALDKMVKDTAVSYKDVSNTCTDAMANYLMNSGYFKTVINYRDSMNYPIHAQRFAQQRQTQYRMDDDASIFLDYVVLSDKLMSNIYCLDRDVIANFPEFENSTMMETIGTRLRWSIVHKNDSTNKPYRRTDNLFYGNSVNPELFGSDENHRKLLTNAAGYLGETFANELLPHMQRAGRIYYRSNNSQMVAAEKLLLSEDYRGAAEKYNQLTNSKNQNIATKASYNMALICEIEGILEASIDWLSRSAKLANKYDYKHISRCEEYTALLQKWLKEMETLDNLLLDRESHAAVQQHMFPFLP